MKKKVLALFSAVVMAVSLFGTSAAIFPTAVLADEGYGVLIKYDNDKSIYDESFDQYFKEGKAKEGVEALLNAGKVTVNGFEVPSQSANGDDAVYFEMNGVHAIWQLESGNWSWQAHDKLNSDSTGEGVATFEEARKNFMNGATQLRSTSTTIYDTDNDGKADSISMFIFSACQVEKVEVNGDVATITGVPVDATSYNTDGGPNDKETRDIPVANLDVKEGDTALYWYAADGWHMESCIPLVGILAGKGADGRILFTPEGEEQQAYDDALILRYNMQAGSRPNQVVSSTGYLELNDIPVTMFMTPSGHVVGISRMDKASEALTRAIAFAEEKEADYVVSEDGSDVPASKKWVTANIYNTFKASLDKAKEVAADENATNAQKDAAVQALGNNYGGRNGLATKAQAGTLVENKILDTVVVSMGDDGKITDEQYNEIFAEGNAADGIKALIAAGKVAINGFAIPASAEELEAEYPDGYTVDESAWLTKVEGGWKVDRNTYETYEEAAVATLGRISAGNEIIIYDNDGDGRADEIAGSYVEAFIVDAITVNEDGSYSYARASYTQTETDGRIYDGNHFTAETGEKIPADRVDETIKVGDMALFWKAPDGWHVIRALEANGILVDGKDHATYNIDGVEYNDAMRFSRDNIIISNRCGEFVNAHKYFGLNNNDEGLKVSLWFAPTTDPEKQGAPAGFTDGGNGKVFLAKAIEIAKEKLDSVFYVVEGAGGNDETKSAWVTKEVYDELKDAIETAEKVLETEDSGALLDFQVYKLYLTLHGNQNDIGAKFAGFGQVGFDNQIHEIIPATDVELTPISATISTGSQIALEAKVTPEDTTDDIIWTSSNEKVATVDENGVVTALTYGKATITVTVGEQSATFDLQTRFYDVLESNVSAGVFKTVYWGADSKLVSGYDGGVYFAPEKAVTRAEMAVFLYRLAGRPSVKTTTSAFSDVTAELVSAGALKAISWAVEAGITKGYDDGTFRPEGLCTRAEMAVFLYRLAGKPAVSTDAKATFSDMDGVSGGALKAISWAVEAGITKGYGDGTFKPTDSCSRANTVTFMYRFDNLDK